MAQVVAREMPAAAPEAVAGQLVQMYDRVLRLPGSAVLVADLPSVAAADGPAAHVLLMPQPNPFTGEPEMVIMDIFTHPATRGKGVGKQMLRHSRAWAEAMGCRSLVAQIALQNSASLALFRAAGFQVERVTAGLRF